LTSNGPLDPAEAYAQLGTIKLAETDLAGVLATIAGLAQRTIPGAAEVSVTLIRDGKAHTAAFTGDLAMRMDEPQYQSGNGPCLDASAGAVSLSVTETETESRWPRWASSASEQGVLSSLSIGLPIQEMVVGALNVYAVSAHAFNDDAIAVAEKFADYAAVALANAQLYDSTATLAQHMRDAMASRAVIEQAKGIIMGGRRCSADEAFDILVKLSQSSNRKLRDVAEVLVAKAAASPEGQRRG
jgi:GAF domain-containing protein